MNLIKSIRSFKFAINGIRLVLRENNFRVHIFAIVLVVTAGVWFEITRAEWLWITAAMSAVLVTECINTAIEKLTDIVSPGYNKLAGEVKDLAAGAVLLAALFAGVSGCIIFIPQILEQLNGQ